MACTPQNLGYSNLSAVDAGRNFYTNPTIFSLDDTLDFNPNQILSKFIYQGNSCIVQALPGYYSDGFVTRFYTNGTLNPTNNVQKTTTFRYCYDGRLFQFNNINTYFAGGLPANVTLFLGVNDGDNFFDGCFESTFETGNIENASISNFTQLPYSTCQDCLITNNPIQYLPSGNYLFKSCFSEDTKVFNVTNSNVFYSGGVTTYTGTCYSLVSATTQSAITQVTNLTYENCSVSQCVPPPTPTPINTSIYVKSCCDNIFYQVESGTLRTIGSVYSQPPTDFCYYVVPKPTVLPSEILIIDDTNFQLVSDCNSPLCQKCSQQPITANTANQCEPLTILPLGLKCNVVNPTIENPFGGILSVNITGGTAPYTVVWTPGGTGTTILNQTAGSFVATVTDYWGDFVEKITCTLELPLVCNFTPSVTQFFPTATPVIPTPFPTVPITATLVPTLITRTPVTPTVTPTITPTPTPTPTPTLNCRLIRFENNTGLDQAIEVTDCRPGQPPLTYFLILQGDPFTGFGQQETLCVSSYDPLTEITIIPLGGC